VLASTEENGGFGTSNDGDTSNFLLLTIESAVLPLRRFSFDRPIQP
jgi:hypothetical protein